MKASIVLRKNNADNKITVIEWNYLDSLFVAPFSNVNFRLFNRATYRDFLGVHGFEPPAPFLTRRFNFILASSNMKGLDAPVSTSTLIVESAIVTFANTSFLSLLAFFVLIKLRIHDESNCISSRCSSWALTSAVSLLRIGQSWACAPHRTRSTSKERDPSSCLHPLSLALRLWWYWRLATTQVIEFIAICPTINLVLGPGFRLVSRVRPELH